MTITLREAGLDEMPRLAHLKRQIHQVHVEGRPDLFTPYQRLDEFADHAAAKHCSLVLAENEKNVVGYAMIQYMERPAGAYMHARKFMHVEEFCVDEKCHRMGIGTLLMQKLKELAKENGYPRIELDVWNFNEGAKRFYEAAGMNAYRTFMEMNVE